MYQGYKVVTVTPKVRRKYLKVLLPYLLRNKPFVDHHMFYLNTDSGDDVAYVDGLCRDPFFSRIPGQLTYAKNDSLWPVWKYNCDPDTIYVRIDDDICYIHPNTVERLVEVRLAHPEPFLVYPIIVNNNMDVILRDQFQMKIKTWAYEMEQNWAYGLEKHYKFFYEYPDIFRDYKFDYVEVAPQRIFINCCCWFGKDFAEFGGDLSKIVEPYDTLDVKNKIDEELVVSDTLPRRLGRKNAITSSGLVCHYSFSWQHPVMDVCGLYERYLELSKQVMGKYRLI